MTEKRVGLRAAMDGGRAEIASLRIRAAESALRNNAAAIAEVKAQIAGLEALAARLAKELAEAPAVLERYQREKAALEAAASKATRTASPSVMPKVAKLDEMLVAVSATIKRVLASGVPREVIEQQLGELAVARALGEVQ